jgi:hypothetical protein
MGKYFMMNQITKKTRDNGVGCPPCGGEGHGLQPLHPAQRGPAPAGAHAIFGGRATPLRAESEPRMASEIRERWGGDGPAAMHELSSPQGQRTQFCLWIS